MASLCSQVARAHARWLEPIDPKYCFDDINEKCEEINKLLENFSLEYCGEVEESYHVSETIKAAKELIKELSYHLDELQEMEDNQDLHQEDY